MSNPAPPKPNGSCGLFGSRSFLRLSGSGSSPWEKPKGRSAMLQRYSPHATEVASRVTLRVNSPVEGPTRRGRSELGALWWAS